MYLGKPEDQRHQGGPCSTTSPTCEPLTYLASLPRINSLAHPLAPSGRHVPRHHLSLPRRPSPHPSRRSRLLPWLSLWFQEDPRCEPRRLAPPRGSIPPLQRPERANILDSHGLHRPFSTTREILALLTNIPLENTKTPPRPRIPFRTTGIHGLPSRISRPSLLQGALTFIRCGFLFSPANYDQPEPRSHPDWLLGMGCFRGRTIHPGTTPLSFKSHRLGFYVRPKSDHRSPWSVLRNPGFYRLVDPSTST